MHNRKRLLKKAFEQKRSKNNRINIHVVKRINKKRHLINNTNVRFKRKKNRYKKVERTIFNKKRRTKNQRKIVRRQFSDSIKNYKINQNNIFQQHYFAKIYEN